MVTSKSRLSCVPRDIKLCFICRGSILSLYQGFIFPTPSLAQSASWSLSEVLILQPPGCGRSLTACLVSKLDDKWDLLFQTPMLFMGSFAKDSLGIASFFSFILGISVMIQGCGSVVCLFVLGSWGEGIAFFSMSRGGSNENINKAGEGRSLLKMLCSVMWSVTGTRNYNAVIFYVGTTILRYFFRETGLHTNNINAFCHL